MTNPSGPIRALVLGDARIVTHIAEIEPTAEVVFAAALYLVLERGNPLSRRRLEELLWPDVDGSVASHRLRQTLLKLRKLGLEFTSGSKGQLRLAAVDVTVDSDALELCDPALQGEASRSFEILAGYSPRLSEAFADWVDRKKRDIASRITPMMLQAMAEARRRGRWWELEICAHRFLELSPYNEEGTLALAEALAMRGEKIEAVRRLDKYLSDVGASDVDLRVAAVIMRRRIVEKMPSTHSSHPEIPLFGRADLMNRLIDSLDGIALGGYSYLYGDAGIGKTRIVQEFLSFASLQGIRTCRVQCRSNDESYPLGLLLSLIPLLLGTRGAIGSSPETLAYLETVTQHRPGSDKSNGASFGSGFAYMRLEQALVDLFGAISEDVPVIVAVEDLHWIDAASETVLFRVAADLQDRPVFFLFTSRSPVKASIAEMTKSACVLPIPPLEKTAAQALILSIMEQRNSAIGDEYLNWCTNVAEGNPYFLQELATHWLESGHQQTVPPSLTAVLNQRLRLLSATALQLLQTCSLLEDHASLENIEAMLELAPHALVRSIDELSSGGMITIGATKPGSGDSSPLSTRHELLSDTALAQLTPPALAYLHRRAAIILEKAIDRSGDASMLWACAKHWQLAGDGNQALRLAKSCAAHLLQSALPSDAAAAYEKALRYCATDKDVLGVLENKVTALYLSSAFHEVSEVAVQARTLKARLYPSESQHDAMELMSMRAEWQALSWHNCLSQARACLAATDATRAHRIEAGVMALMLTTLVVDQSGNEAIIEEIEDLGRDQEVPSSLMLQARMVYHTSWGSFAEGVKAARLLVSEDRTKGNIGHLFRSLCNAAATFRGAGHSGEALSCLHEALTLADDHHLPNAKLRALPMLAHMALELGDTREARRCYTLLQGISIPATDRFAHLEFRSIGARLALLDRDPDEASRLWNSGIDLGELNGIPHRMTYNAALQVAIQLAKTGAAAASSVRILESAHLQSRGNLYQAFATFALYVGLQSIGEGDRAEIILREYCRYHRREPWEAPTHLLDLIQNAHQGNLHST